MKQIYHSNATTNIRLCSEINKSNLPNNILAEKYEVSKDTICKWENRENFKDKNSKPFIPKTNGIVEKANDESSLKSKYLPICSFRTGFIDL
ncbi:MAG: hypothetical protein DRJ01_14455 [Bacteroidetes bacterium]|nr:MAG: hypothetical protein DRJ01_14455 [Bacteroidota bacterium]